MDRTRFRGWGGFVELGPLVGDQTAQTCNELWMEQVAPVIDAWRYHAELLPRPVGRAAVDEVLDAANDGVQSLLRRRDDGVIELYQASDRTYAGYGNLYTAIAALAPHLEDVRFFIGEW